MSSFIILLLGEKINSSPLREKLDEGVSSSASRSLLDLDDTILVDDGLSEKTGARFVGDLPLRSGSSARAHWKHSIL